MADRPGLKKTLGLADVFAISTGAMFSSGFFLLPGIAAVESGSSVSLAYLLAGILILPAMFSVAELATAMPRAGGAYYFLDRSMGPLMGTIGGLGTWLALVLKTAFALLGMGAYLMLFIDVPIEAVAVGLTVVFAVFNVVGAKETSRLQRLLVFTLVLVLGFFIAQGVAWVVDQGPVQLLSHHNERFLEHGVDGLFATAGIVFVSYAGLTKVASVAEEVHDPDRNIPLGMMLSLGTATVVYVLGVGIMTLALDADAFHATLTPVADAGRVIFVWIPPEAGLWLVVLAATAAFASTGNAGILSSSRYPLAMARDSILPSHFASLSRRLGTPTLSIATTSVVIVVLIIAFDISAVAKLASAFQLMLFGLINLALIVMRESKIDFYHPGYRAPLYPWMQIAGLIIPLWLIVEMGWLAVLFTAGVVAVCIIWYYAYADRRTVRHGAVYHVFERIGRRVYRGLDDELRGIVAERGLEESDPVEQLVVDAKLVELIGESTYADAIDAVCKSLDEDAQDSAANIREPLLSRAPSVHVIAGFALVHACVEGMSSSRLVLVRAANCVVIPGQERGSRRRVYACAVLVGPEEDLAVHLRMLAYIGRRVAGTDFRHAWLEARTTAKLKEVLLREDRFHNLKVADGTPAAALIGRKLEDADFGRGVIIALLQRRDASTFVPGASDEVRAGDRLTAIGDPDSIRQFRERFEPTNGNDNEWSPSAGKRQNSAKR